MSDQDNSRKKHRQERSRWITARLAEVGITAAEAALLNVVHYGVNVPRHDLCRRAATHDYSLTDAVTLSEAQEACEQCFDKDWLQVVDESVLAQLQAEVQSSGLLGPIYGYPPLGSVEFTAEGARQWFLICCQLGFRVGDTDSFAYTDVVHEKVAYWLTTESKARAEIEELKAWPDMTSIVGPVPVGPWRAQWWRRFNSGFRFDTESHKHWQGNHTSGDSCWFNPEDLAFDFTQAQKILEQHNVSVGEFLTLKSLETAHHTTQLIDNVKTYLAKWAPALHDIDERVAIQACVDRGWLHSVDEQAFTDILAMVKADDATMPMPLDFQRYAYELDYTMAGADAYRALSAEIHGSDWENELIVQRCYYREEHRYCATETGILSIQDEYSEHADVLRKARVVPIGTWCVYWWRRYAAGFRVELIFGEPTFP